MKKRKLNCVDRTRPEFFFLHLEVFSAKSSVFGIVFLPIEVIFSQATKYNP
ncbi:hypothetical protein [Victivallis sp. Marseille-Q1083]|uniref:hypothetical protein n=1 Tax=Victivallis sp. Marseille-Q1083 TaxID=2717288 RepID=UPI00158A7A84|nr:hypothetical protein [Victivallis sp. Marseille-Q1083]